MIPIGYICSIPDGTVAFFIPATSLTVYKNIILFIYLIRLGILDIFTNLDIIVKPNRFDIFVKFNAIFFVCL